METVTVTVKESGVVDVFVDYEWQDGQDEPGVDVFIDHEWQGRQDEPEAEVVK